jgi:uridine kinase/ribulose-5-phosphate 4-epimerase/fuculose-1-phosphate aldolase
MNLVKPYIIGIAGESGVGKSTMTGIVQLFFGKENTITLSTDDLHRWERTSPNWDIFTHLNPEANNLELGDIHLKELSEGNSIYRSAYDHGTGTFKAPEKIESNRIIINQGLHAFYTEQSQQLTDLKIFINTDETLRTHWKVIRDTEKRGYRYGAVIDAINRRKPDALKINEKQIAIADVIVDMVPEKAIKNVGDKNEVVDVVITYRFNKPANEYLFSFVKDYNRDIKDFIELSNNLGEDILMCQHTGGNISVKTGDHMFIKASGFKMKDVSRVNGYSIVRPGMMKGITSSEKYDVLFESDMFFTGKRPSMEVGLHALLNKYTIHLHPIYLTAILCLANAKEVLQELYHAYEYTYVPYVAPGYSLFKALERLNDKPNLIFLQNHGVIVSSDSKEEALALVKDITSRAEVYLNTFKTFTLAFAKEKKSEHFYFPDAVIFSDKKQTPEVLAFNNYIHYITETLKSRHTLLSNDMFELLSLESEKYRKSL